MSDFGEYYDVVWFDEENVELSVEIDVDVEDLGEEKILLVVFLLY